MGSGGSSPGRSIGLEVVFECRRRLHGELPDGLDSGRESDWSWLPLGHLLSSRRRSEPALVLSGSAYVSAATLPWTDIGLTVQAGDDVTITASGTYGIAGSDPGKTPQSLGCAGDGGGRPVVVSSLMIWASIARIGDGTPFCIGTGVHIPFAAAGELFATFNDEPPFSDNWGGVTIHWQIRRHP